MGLLSSIKKAVSKVVSSIKNTVASKISPSTKISSSSSGAAGAVGYKAPQANTIAPKAPTTTSKTSQANTIAPKAPTTTSKTSSNSLGNNAKGPTNNPSSYSLPVSQVKIPSSSSSSNSKSSSGGGSSSQSNNTVFGGASSSRLQNSLSNMGVGGLTANKVPVQSYNPKGSIYSGFGGDALGPIEGTGQLGPTTAPKSTSSNNGQLFQLPTSTQDSSGLQKEIQDRLNQIRSQQYNTGSGKPLNYNNGASSMAAVGAIDNSNTTNPNTTNPNANFDANTSPSFTITETTQYNPYTRERIEPGNVGKTIPRPTEEYKQQNAFIPDWERQGFRSEGEYNRYLQNEEKQSRRRDEETDYQGLIQQLAGSRAEDNSDYEKQMEWYNKAIDAKNKFDMATAEKLGAVANTGADLNFKQGQQQVLQNQYAVQQNSLQNAINQYQQGIGFSLENQGLIQQALNQAAGLASPVQVTPGNSLTTPYGEEIFSGLGGLNAFDNYKANKATSVALGKQVTTMSAGANEASKQFENLQSLMQSNNINPFELTQGNFIANLGKKITDPRVMAQFDQAYAAFQGSVNAIANTPGVQLTDPSIRSAILDLNAKNLSLPDLQALYNQIMMSAQGSINAALQQAQLYDQGGTNSVIGQVSPYQAPQVQVQQTSPTQQAPSGGSSSSGSGGSSGVGSDGLIRL